MIHIGLTAVSIQHGIWSISVYKLPYSSFWYRAYKTVYFLAIFEENDSGHGANLVSRSEPSKRGNFGANLITLANFETIFSLGIDRNQV